MKILQRFKEFPMYFYQVIFLQDEILNKKIIMRTTPVGAMACGLASLLAMPNIGALIILSALIVYASLYSLILMFSVKSEYKTPGKFALCVDNILLSFIISLIITIPLVTMFFPVVYYNYGEEYLMPLIAIVFGIIFFFHNLRLSVYLFREPDLDHLFSAQMVPFILALALIYYVMNHAKFLG